METEGAGEEGAHGSTDDATANEEGAGADETAGEEAAKAAAAEAGERDRLSPASGSGASVHSATKSASATLLITLVMLNSN